ncbi:MAG: RNA polymerase sigma factor [Verrucomicrobiae bacterium]|nr:RNA polymerase sigma factor [Verrucomicrobiae bacterium]
MSDAGADKSGGRGDSFESIESVYLAYEAELLRFAKRIVKNDDDAQDLVQEAFMRLYANFNTVTQPRAWLYRTVHNLALNKKRHDEKVIPLNVGSDNNGNTSFEDVVSESPLPNEIIASVEMVERTKEIIGRLNERSKLVVHLKFSEGLSYKEISEKTGLSVSNVGFILHQTLKQLANEFKNAGLLK